ncbi:hypothetical protein I546_1536 [Mycobacterium kansasii 732]|nr:hypothetical protein I546_1536 [Mycobacterium kansasii 732]
MSARPRSPAPIATSLHFDVVNTSELLGSGNHPHETLAHAAVSSVP